MRIIHCADIHLDSKMESNLTKEQARERKNEILLTFLDMVEYGAKNKADAILIAGDLFDTGRVSRKTANIITDCIISHPGIDFLYLKGNHDVDSFLDNLEQMPGNLKLFGDSWTGYQYECKRNEGETLEEKRKVVITGVELGKDNRQWIYDSLSLNAADWNIVTLHGQESQSRNGDAEEVIALKELKNRNIDYLALGHIHTYKTAKLDERGTYCYCGCLEGRGFDECGEKGFVVLDISEKEIHSAFVKAGRRAFYEEHIEVSGLQTTSEIERRIKEVMDQSGATSKDLIKLVLEGEMEVSGEKDISYLQKKLSENYYFVKIYDRTRRKINMEEFQFDVSLKGEFVRSVLSSRLSQKEKEDIILAGIRALSGEEWDA